MTTAAIDHQHLPVEVMVDDGAYGTDDGAAVRYMSRIGTLTITGFWPRYRVRVGDTILQSYRMLADDRWVLLSDAPAALFAVPEFTPDPDYLAAAGIGV